MTPSKSFVIIDDVSAVLQTTYCQAITPQISNDSHLHVIPYALLFLLSISLAEINDPGPFFLRSYSCNLLPRLSYHFS